MALRGRNDKSPLVQTAMGHAITQWERSPQARESLPWSGILSAAQHVSNLTNDVRVRGASADLHTLKAYQPGDRAFMVGGTPDDRTGTAFPTQQVDVGAWSPKLTVRDVMAARSKMLPAAQQQAHPVLGTWRVATHKEPAKNRVDIDLSTAFDSRKRAEDATLANNEDAMFDMQRMREKSNESIRAERGLGPRGPKGDRQEEIARRHEPRRR